VTAGGGLGSLVVTSQMPTGEAGHVRRGDQHGIGVGRRDGTDWLSRHLGDVDPAASAAARQRWPDRWDARWRSALNRLGFPDVPSYLRERHIVEHRTVNAIAAEVGLTNHAVESALRRHGLSRMAHAAKRHVARERAAQVAADLGFGSVAGYVAHRQSEGWTWRAMSADCGQPQSWLRRHGGQEG
jgi:hypothetical protein